MDFHVNKYQILLLTTIVFYLKFLFNDDLLKYEKFFLQFSFMLQARTHFYWQTLTLIFADNFFFSLSKYQLS